MALDPLTAAFDLGKMAIDKIWPNKADQVKELRKLEALRQSGDLARLTAHVKLMTSQMAVNAEQARHKSVFVAGGRPAVIWVGAAGLAYASIIEPMARFIATMCGYDGPFPEIDTTISLQVLMGLLGFAGLRSYDKKMGTETNVVGKSE